MWIEFWKAGPGPAEGVDFGHQMATHSISPHELIDPILQKRDAILTLAGRGGQRQQFLLAWQCVGQPNIAPGDGNRMARRNPVRSS